MREDDTLDVICLHGVVLTVAFLLFVAYVEFRVGVRRVYYAAVFARGWACSLVHTSDLYSDTSKDHL